MPSISTGTTGTGSYEAYNPDRASDLPRAESPPPLPGTENARVLPVGQAVEMDAATGSPAHPPQNFGQFNQLRDSDADVAGMLALQQARTDSPHRHDTYFSEASKYSQDESQYVPPRQVWNQGPGRSSPSVPSPLNLPSQPREQPDRAPAPRAGSDVGTYYEDVDPRFTEPAPRQGEPIGYEDQHNAPGSRSPAISERSAFTSVSQRGINPRWNPGPGQGYGQQIPQRRPVNRAENVNVLSANPDFQLPSTRGGNPNRGPAGGMIPDSAYPGI